MLAAALDSATEAEVVAIDRLRFVVAPLLGEQRRQRVPRRMHPGPRLGVAKIVVAPDAFAQMVERRLDIAPVILEFAVQHHFGNAKDVPGIVAEETTAGRHTLH